MSFANIRKGNQLRLRRPDSPNQEHGDAIVRDSHPLPLQNEANLQRSNLELLLLYGIKSKRELRHSAGSAIISSNISPAIDVNASRTGR